MDDTMMPSLQTKIKVDPDRGKSQMISPNPNRVKYVTEILAALAENHVSFASVMRMNKKKLKTLAEQGYTKLKHGRFDEARKIFELLSFVDHKNYFYHLALGGAYQKMRQYLDAAFQYTECLKFDPENTNALVNRGEIFLRHKNYKRAATDFRVAILLDKNGSDLFANRARALVIAIKRSMAKSKGQNDVPLVDSPSKRRRIQPAVLMSKKAKGAKLVKK